MFDVLTYLFEQYRDPDAFGDRGSLMRQLEAAGFEDEEINDALDWLDNVANMVDGLYASADDALACAFTQMPKLERLPTDVRGLIQFLEDHGALSPSQREMVIDRLCELPDDDINVGSAKLVALMVLWAQKAELPILLGEELLDAIHGEPTMQ
jgi:Smg protein